MLHPYKKVSYQAPKSHLPRRGRKGSFTLIHAGPSPTVSKSRGLVCLCTQLLARQTAMNIPLSKVLAQKSYGFLTGQPKAKLFCLMRQKNSLDSPAPIWTGSQRCWAAGNSAAVVSDGKHTSGAIQVLSVATTLQSWPVLHINRIWTTQSLLPALFPFLFFPQIDETKTQVVKGSWLLVEHVRKLRECRVI